MVGLHGAGYFRQVRRELGLSQRELAARVEVHPSSIARAESGTAVSIELLERVLALAQMRLVVVDSRGAEQSTEPLGMSRDNAGRRLPAHLPSWPTTLCDTRTWTPRPGRGQVTVSHGRRPVRDVLGPVDVLGQVDGPGPVEGAQGGAEPGGAEPGDAEPGDALPKGRGRRWIERGWRNRPSLSDVQLRRFHQLSYRDSALLLPFLRPGTHIREIPSSTESDDDRSGTAMSNCLATASRIDAVAEHVIYGVPLAPLLTERERRQLDETRREREREWWEALEAGAALGDFDD